MTADDVDAAALHLLVEYGRLFDDRDAASFAQLFAEDAVVQTPFGDDLVGRPQIRAMVQRTPPGGEHQIEQPEIVDRSEDTVTTRTTFSATTGSGRAMAGRYENTLRLTADGWKIAHHRIVVE